MSTAFYIKQNDTKPFLEANLRMANNTAISLVNASQVRFKMNQRNNTTLKVNGVCNISNAATGSVRYEWSGSDTNTNGRYYGEFEILFDDGKIQTVPTKDFVLIEIINDLP